MLKNENSNLTEMILQRSTTIPFSFTLRKSTNVAKSTEKDYMYKFDKFKDMGIELTNYVFEKNHANAGIHMHGTVSVPKKFNMKRFRTRGWHMHLTEIYDKGGWDQYCSKEQMLAHIDELGPIDTISSKDDESEDYSLVGFTMPKHKLF